LLRLWLSRLRLIAVLDAVYGVHHGVKGLFNLSVRLLHEAFKTAPQLIPFFGLTLLELLRLSLCLGLLGSSQRLLLALLCHKNTLMFDLSLEQLLISSLSLFLGHQLSDELSRLFLVGEPTIVFDRVGEPPLYNLL
jgi:hypothetical protein